MVEKNLYGCNMNIPNICFYMSVLMLFFLEYAGISDISMNRQFNITIIIGLIDIINQLNRKKISQ